MEYKIRANARELRLFGVWCARQVQHLMNDQRSIDALNVSERFANDDASIEELAAASAAASAAAWAAASVAQENHMREILKECGK